MIAEVFQNLTGDGGLMWLTGWRCIVCGDMVDATILKHRQSAQSASVSRTRRRFAPSLR
jgi:hypothetical protein